MRTTLKYKYLILFCAGVLSLMGIVPATAYDTAPRISDREIIESLAELKQGYKNLNLRIDDMNQSLNQRFDAIDKRFDDMNQSLNQRFDVIDKRFDEMTQSSNKKFDEMTQNFNQRFEEMHAMILTLFTSVMALVIAMIGYMIWDRKTAQQPFKHQLEQLGNQVSTVETTMETQLDMKNPSGPVIARLLASLRKLAETDGKVAEVLRSFSLL